MRHVNPCRDSIVYLHFAMHDEDPLDSGIDEEVNMIMDE